jgi:hypothetical protein
MLPNLAGRVLGAARSLWRTCCVLEPVRFDRGRVARASYVWRSRERPRVPPPESHEWIGHGRFPRLPRANPCRSAPRECVALGHGSYGSPEVRTHKRRPQSTEATTATTRPFSMNCFTRLGHPSRLSRATTGDYSPAGYTREEGTVLFAQRIVLEEIEIDNEAHTWHTDSPDLPLDRRAAKEAAAWILG